MGQFLVIHVCGVYLDPHNQYAAFEPHGARRFDSSEAARAVADRAHGRAAVTVDTGSDQGATSGGAQSLDTDPQRIARL